MSLIGASKIILVPKRYLAQNAINNSIFNGGTTGFNANSCTTSAVNGIATLTGTGTSDTTPNIYQSLSTVVGKKWFYSAWMQLDINNDQNPYLTFRSEGSPLVDGRVTNPIPGQWYKMSALTTAGTTSKTCAFATVYTTVAAHAGKIHRVKEPMAICLTDLFGVGWDTYPKSRYERIFNKFIPVSAKVFR